MYTDSKVQNLFDMNFSEAGIGSEAAVQKDENKKESDIQNVTRHVAEKGVSGSPERSFSGVVKIVWFYDNNSFEEFIPRK
jgi:hypothetical protein